jgi:hypothetical protein
VLASGSFRVSDLNMYSSMSGTPSDLQNAMTPSGALLYWLCLYMTAKARKVPMAHTRPGFASTAPEKSNTKITNKAKATTRKYNWMRAKLFENNHGITKLGRAHAKHTHKNTISVSMQTEAKKPPHPKQRRRIAAFVFLLLTVVSSISIPSSSSLW